MRKLFGLFLIALLFIIAKSSQTQIVISTDGSIPDSSAILDIQSTSQGLLLPRLTTAQRDSIQVPAIGLMIFNTDTKILEVFSGTQWTNLKGEKTSGVVCGVSTVDFGGITYNTVLHNNRCWLDRNLGATQVANAIDDFLSFGYYYQWGRAGDGHQHPANSTSSTLANTSTPGHSLFILPSATPYDWQNPQEPNLWEPHNNYVNNPCPDDWKVPNQSEWNEAVSGWSTIADAYNSPLKISTAGYRSRTDGTIGGENTAAYWSASIFNNNSRMNYFDNTSIGTYHKYRAWGYSVRCIEAASNEAYTLFSRTYGGSEYDRAYSLGQTNQGGFVIAGMTEIAGSGDDFLFLKGDSIGNLEIAKAYDAGSNEVCSAVKLTTDNGYILTGESGSDVYNLKLDSLGNVAWEEKTNYGGFERNKDVIQDSDGGFVFIGSTSGFGAGGSDNLVTKRDPSGNSVWGWAIGDTGNENGYGLVKDTDGGYAYCGASNSSGAGGYDLQFQKLDASGNPQWGWYMGGTDDDYGRGLTIAHDSGYVIVGYTNSFGAGGADLYVRKVNADGTTDWGSVIGGAGEDFGYSVVLTEDHGFAIAGQTRSFGAGSGDVWFVKLDSIGNFEWSWAFGGTDHESGESVIVGDDGYYYVAGYTKSFGVGGGTHDALLIKFAPDGGTCLGYYVGLPAESANMTFADDETFEAVPVNELFFQRINGGEISTRVNITRIPDQEDGSRGITTTTTTDITPNTTTICEE